MILKEKINQYKFSIILFIHGNSILFHAERFDTEFSDQVSSSNAFES